MPRLSAAAQLSRCAAYISGGGSGLKATCRSSRLTKWRYTCFLWEHPVLAETPKRAGADSGSIAQLRLEGLSKPGVYRVEEAVTTDLFEQIIQSRGIEIVSNCQ